jgi:trans-aconitate 2-methyltransferase
MVKTDAWNPAQYDRFRAERSQPLFDLLSLVQKAPNMRVVDLGCGTGEWTRHVHDAFGAKSTLGLDRSDAMLAKAASLAPLPGLSFANQDIARWANERQEDDTYDLVLSNAALHWLPSHEALVARISDAVGPQGQLAVQVPANFDHATHRVASEIAREPEFQDALGEGGAPVFVLPPESYASMLYRLGYAEQHVRLQVYPHVLPSRDDVIEWVKGTLLTGYESHLSPPAFARFMTRYRERLVAQLPDTRPFFYPFKRILFWGRKG